MQQDRNNVIQDKDETQRQDKNDRTRHNKMKAV